MNNTLFVFVISFNEEELLTTIESAYSNASEPEKLFFGIYEQRTDDNFVDLTSYKNIKKVECKYEFPRGTGIARLNAFMLNNNEDYCMYVDSHTLFDPGWDVELKNQFKNLKNYYEKPFISYNIDYWYRDNDGNIVQRYTFNPTILLPISVTRPSGIHFEMYSEGFPDEIKFKEYFLCSGQFAFGEMQAFKECLPDPRIFFYGEEQLLAIRLSTRGWRIFASNTNVLHHKGVTEEDWQGVNFWRAIAGREDCRDAFRDSDLEFFTKPLTGITYDILSGKELGYWGAPDQNSYEQYIEKLGFDYRSLNEIQR
jgi:hypothetical protein